MEKLKRTNHLWNLFIAFTIGFAVASILFTGAMMAVGTALHIAQNHSH